MYNFQVRLHLPMLLPCTAAVLIMVMAFQLRRIEQDRTVKSTILTLASCVSPVNVVLPSRLVAYVAALGPVAAFLPVTDIAILQSRNLDFGLLPIMMFFLAIAVVLVLSNCDCRGICRVRPGLCRTPTVTQYNIFYIYTFIARTSVFCLT